MSILCYRSHRNEQYPSFILFSFSNMIGVPNDHKLISQLL
uniref:Uncharacterized protein n=1 Tax=Rhizophora mucronata TaxID=61149 RepID=A0A2P2JPR4_RHIMU